MFYLKGNVYMEINGDVSDNGLGEGFTGINVGNVISQLDSIASAWRGAMRLFDSTVQEFTEDLSKNWASPKAAAFSQDFIQRISLRSKQFGDEFSDFMRAACDCGRDLCVAHGITVPSAFYRWLDSNYSQGGYVIGVPCQESFNGAAGMNIDAVQNITSSFVKKMQTTVKYAFKDLPNSISFYDASGNLMRGYSHNIAKTYEEVEQAINEEVVKLNGIIEEEINNINLAQSSAETSMSSNNN